MIESIYIEILPTSRNFYKETKNIRKIFKTFTAMIFLKSVALQRIKMLLDCDVTVRIINPPTNIAWRNQGATSVKIDIFVWKNFYNLTFNCQGQWNGMITYNKPKDGIALGLFTWRFRHRLNIKPKVNSILKLNQTFLRMSQRREKNILGGGKFHLIERENAQKFLNLPTFPFPCCNLTACFSFGFLLSIEKRLHRDWKTRKQKHSKSFMIRKIWLISMLSTAHSFRMLFIDEPATQHLPLRFWFHRLPFDFS